MKLYAKKVGANLFQIVATQDKATHYCPKSGPDKGKFLPLEDDLDRLEQEIVIFNKMGFATGELEMIRFPDGHQQIQPVRRAA